MNQSFLIHTLLTDYRMPIKISHFMRSTLLLFLILLIAGNCYSQVSIDEIDFENNKIEQLNLLTEILSIPNNAHYPAQIDQNINWFHKQFNQLGFHTKTLESKGLPLFYAEKHLDDAKPAVLIYMHFDGQPADSSEWDQESPYQPVIKTKNDSEIWESVKSTVDNPDPNWRIFARSAADDKGPIAMFISALKLLEEYQIDPAVNIKVVLDSMEELGSPFLAPVVKEHRKLLSSDYLVVFDGPIHDSGLPTLLYGVRGITTLSMEIYGPSQPQHSGHFGNYAPNPVFRAAELLASMKNEDGKVIIPGFYNGVHLDNETLDLLASVPDNETKIKKRGGFAIPEKVGETYQESIQYPSLSVLGIKSGWVGNETRTIVPDKVIIEMDIRTVPETNSNRLVKLVEDHIRKQGYTILTQRPTPDEMLEISKPLYFSAQTNMFPFRTSVQSNIGEWLRKSLMRVHQKEIVQVRLSGGSLPLSFFINELNIPAVLVPLVNADNNQHSPNENLRLENYFDGIKSITSILTNNP